MFVSGTLPSDLASRNTTCRISNGKMNDIMKIVIWRIWFINKAKEQKGGFLSKLLGTLGASLLGNLLTG